MNPMVAQALRSFHRSHSCAADDLAQAAMIALWKRGNPTVLGEAYTVARSAMIDEMRRWYGRGKHNPHFVQWLDYADDRADPASDPESHMRVKDAMRIIMRDLTQIERSTVDRCVAGQSSAEIAREDHVSEPAISCRMRGIRRKLAAAV